MTESLLADAAAAHNGHHHTLKDHSGYHENAFPGKEDQMLQVTEYLSEKAFIPAALAQNEVSWFYGYVTMFVHSCKA